MVETSKDTLDALILKGLEVIEEILDEQKKLELSLREGFLLMSKARYSMGTKSVGVLQLPTEDGRQIDALVRVDHEPANAGDDVDAAAAAAMTDCLNFFVVRSGDQDPNKAGANDGDGLRKRVNNKRPETIKLTSSVNGAEPEAASTKKRTDPLNWFGVLVPQALRLSQQIFQDNVHSVCRLASLRSHLESIRREYAKVFKELNTIKSMDNLEIK